MGSFGFCCGYCDTPMLSEGPTKHCHCFKCEEDFVDNEELGGCKSTNYLLSPDGEVYEEKDYQGYGVYGDKDAYALLAQTNVEAVREWFTPDMPNMHDWEPTGDNEEDRFLGIDLMHGKRKKTFDEIEDMVMSGKKIQREDMYHHAYKLIKNPIKIVCERCYTEGRYSRPVTSYDDCGESMEHDNQSWTDAHDTEVGWVCNGCYGW